MPRADVQHFSEAVRTRLQDVQQHAASLLGKFRFTADLTWIKVCDDRCIGTGSLFIDNGQTAPADALQVIVKQVKSLSAHRPAPMYLREVAWLAELGHSGWGPKLLAFDDRASLFVSEKVSGEHLGVPHFTAQHRAWVAQALASIHATPAREALVGPEAERRFPWSIERWLPHVTQLHRMPQRTYARLLLLRNLMVKSLDRLPAVRTAIHGDPQQGNILIDASAKRAYLIDFEYACYGDPAFDLAFFAVHLHLSMEQALELLPAYQRAWTAFGRSAQAAAAERLALYVGYQRLFRHVASHKEYTPGADNDYDRWLSRLHDDVAFLVRQKLLPAAVQMPDA